MVRVVLGPLPSASALAWLRNAKQVVAAVRGSVRMPIETPPEVADAFDAYLDEWLAVAEAGDEFRWEAEIDPAAVRHLATYWFNLATALNDRADDLPLPVAPPEGEPFYVAVVSAMTAALAKAPDDEAAIGEKLQTVWPGVGREPLEAEHPEPAAALEPVRVALVDDTDDIRLLLRITLARDPCFDVVGEATNGAEALTLCESTRPDVVVLDYSMPVMDGLTAAGELLERAPGTKVILYTSDTSAAVRAEADRLGALLLAKDAPLGDIARAVRGLGGR